MQTNEFRVRPVTRFVLTHYQDDPDQRATITRTVGEFPNVQTAEEVGVALQALVPGSTLTTIEGRQAEYPPRALAAAMAVRSAPVLEYIAVERAFAPATESYYFDDAESAASFVDKMLKQNREFRTFSREVTDPMRLAERRLRA